LSGAPLAPTGERTGDDEAQAAVFAAVVTVFVLLVVVSSVIAIVHKARSPGRYVRSATHQRRIAVKCFLRRKAGAGGVDRLWTGTGP
jgi:hypothetical protein